MNYNLLMFSQWAPSIGGGWEGNFLVTIDKVTNYTFARTNKQKRLPSPIVTYNQHLLSGRLIFTMD